ncbi:putative GMP synthase [Daphnia magna]|uniref:Putative GMP synthase n=1 Tax=Daphnia magna TaxID=35525 RepID=A0A165A1C8_9CRUS|nr:putative GMP synthase [Daphnia magna]
MEIYSTIFSFPGRHPPTKPWESDHCVESDILALETPDAFLLQQGYKAIIISGGSNSVYAVDASLYDPAIFRLRLPVLGICYGKQRLNKELGGFTLEKREQQFNDYIRCTVGRDKILLMLVSGGVDFAVCAALLQGDDSTRVQAIHIENGFLRKDESEQVITSLQQLVVNPRVVEASLTFHDASTNVLGHQSLSLCRTENHHNDSEIVRQLRLHGRVVEPLQDFHKDEVRALGRELVAKEYALLNRIEFATSEEERLLPEELSSHNQNVATLLPVRTVRVLVIMANGLSRISTTIAPPTHRLT